MKPSTLSIPTQQSLERAALNYLARYAASEASLRRVLENSLKRTARRNPAFAADEERQRAVNAAISQVIEKYRKQGILDDKQFAETKVDSLRRQGRSCRAIVQKLCAKGVSKALIDAALIQNADEASFEEAELAAALMLAKRRKLGTFRKGKADENLLRQDLAALARAGYSLDVARKALKAEAHEEWE